MSSIENRKSEAVSVLRALPDLLVFLCMLVGVALGTVATQFTASLSKLEFVQVSHVNAPIAVLI
jgi:ACR3 family arsenite efflux pump ArsB